MAHFAEINSDTNKVTRVLVISDSDVENNGGEYTAESEQWVKDNFPNPDGLNVFWKQTSYWTMKGKHYAYMRTWHQPIGTDLENTVGIGRILTPDQSKAKRKNYAAVDFTYDSSRDAFIPPRDGLPDHYILDEDSCTWVPPVPYPDDTKSYQWMVETQTWEEVEGDHEHFNKPAYFSDF